MLTVVIRLADDPDLYIALQPDVITEAKRLLLFQCDISHHTDYQHTTFKYVQKNPLKKSAVVMRIGITSVYLTFASLSSKLPFMIGSDRYYIEFADLMPHGKETP